MKIQAIPKMNIQEFATLHGLEIVVSERPRPEGDPLRYYARLDGVEVAKGGVLVSDFANGPTPEDAIRGLHEVYALQILVVDYSSPNSRRTICPHRLIP